MQLTVEVILPLVVGIVSGATGAWISNRIVNAEMWSHLKQHCREIDDLKKDVQRADDCTSESFRRVYEKLDNQNGRLRDIEYQHRLDEQRANRS